MSGKSSGKLDNNQTQQKPLFDKFVPGKTCCKFCGMPLRVRGTTTRRMPDGEVVISRSVRCQSLEAHTYELKEIIRDKSIPVKDVKNPDKAPPKEQQTYDCGGPGIRSIPVDRFVSGQTRCFFCQSSIRVRYKDTERLPDGRVKVSRQVVCKGPKSHQFIYEEIQGDLRADKSAEGFQSKPTEAEVRQPNKTTAPRKTKK